MTATATLQPDPHAVAHLAPALADLKALRVPGGQEYFLAALLVEVCRSSDSHMLTHFEGQGLGYALALHNTQVLDQYECEALRQVFKDAANRVRPDLTE
jgi:hypothetical protein